MGKERDFIFKENQELWEQFVNLKLKSGSNKMTVNQYKPILLTIETDLKIVFTDFNLDEIEWYMSNKSINHQKYLKNFLLHCINYDLIEVNKDLALYLVKIEYKKMIAKLLDLDTKNATGGRNIINEREYKYNGETYYSLTELCNKLNLNYGILIARINENYSLEEAIKNSYNKKEKKIEYLGEIYPSITALCKAHGTTVSKYNSRRKHGYSMEVALNPMPLKDIKKSRKLFEEEQR